MIRKLVRHLLGLDVTDSYITDINYRMEHLAKRLDEAEALLKRLHAR